MKSKKIKRPLLTSICCAILLLTGSATIAMTSGIIEKNFFRITTKIIVDGKLVSSPQILARENQQASITISNNAQQSLKMQLVAKNHVKNNAIEINYDIEHKNGKEEMHAQPQMIVIPGHESVFSISNADHRYEIRVLAKRR